MAIPYVIQSVSSGVPTPGGLNPITLNGVTQGNMLLCGMYSGGGAGGTLTITDSQGNPWNAVATAYLAIDSDTLTVLATIASASGPNTITFYAQGITPSGGLRAVVYEIANCTTTLDGGSGVSLNTTGATSLDSGPIVTAAYNDLLFGFGGLDNATNAVIGPGPDWGNALNFGDSSDPNPIGLAEIQIAAYPGTYRATSTTLNSSEQATILVAFLAGGAFQMIAS